jgi:hypothetical protein
MASSNEPKSMNEKAAPFLEKGEKVLAAGTFLSRMSLNDSSFESDFSDITNRNNIICVTSKRLLVLPQDRVNSMPIKDDVFSATFAEIKISDDGLSLKRPGSDKAQKFFYVYGYKVNKDQFSMFFPGFFEAIEASQKKG